MNFKFSFKSSFSKYFNQSIFGNQAGHYKRLKIDFFNVMCFRKGLKSTYVYTLIFFAVNIFKILFSCCSLIWILHLYVLLLMFLLCRSLVRDRDAYYFWLILLQVLSYSNP